MNTTVVRFYHRGAVVEVEAAPTRSVLDWLREDARCTGTKEGCNEGDCGACTVVIGERPAPGEEGGRDVVRGLRLNTVNACIQFLPTLHGKALFTVEDLQGLAAGPAGAAAAPSAEPPLHPVQQAMVECHGSQCGFCTPGFVMSLFESYERHGACGARPSRQQLADELSGNLCRCTGYRPILDAGQRMFELPPVRLDTAPVLQALQDIGAPAPAADAGWFAPRTLDELARRRVEHPEATVLAGSTDVGLWVTKQFRPLKGLIYLGDVAELRRIEPTPDGGLRIGAGASLEDAWRALAQREPALTDVWLRFASPPVRHAGTLGGNVANGSPIGDAPPVLMALGAAVQLRQGTRQRTLPLEDFYLDYMKNALEPGEFVEALLVPPAPAGAVTRAYKISKRFDCDISAVCAGLRLVLDGGVVREARLAFGGMAATVRRATGAEAALLGQPWTQAAVAAAQAALAADFTPLSDMRASAAYRRQVAQNLLQRFWLETRPDAPLAPARTSVFSVMPHVAA
ncbi:xanthine dehydrogenase small subunit [Piscinibacter sakaiensis]|uniref:Xanthine dehydrogenase, iron-sulfur cluster and FAD-binding subunit A n=1 Tax=Piscinibacter sakaiensis TaxID=1547922 RepID=A0A0K8P105_PISS1|nr:xanthine dehydrogenase small subunit [Piscinibacter sakaiensis]GAP36214.1 xanthine dehydrogenase, iron-sulfur cluster and FAD-binding subunit A [Piscinibacter sakaiensis]